MGLKPSRGRVSTGPGYGEFWHGLAIEGVVTRTVRDSAGALDCIAGPMPGDPYAAPPPARPYVEELGRDPGRLRIGLLASLPEPPVHAECTQGAEEAGRLLESLGHVVEPGHPQALEEEELGNHFQSLLLAHIKRSIEEVAEALGREVGPADFESYTWSVAERGAEVSASAYIASMDWLHAWSRRVRSWWDEGFDLLLTPTLAAPPPRIGALASASGPADEVMERVLALIPFTAPFNVTGQPGISLPLHWSADGLPVGVQLVAAYGREDLLLQVAAQLEQAQPWITRLPPVCA